MGLRTPRLGSGSGRQRPGFRGVPPWGSGLHDWAPGAGGSGRVFAGAGRGVLDSTIGLRVRAAAAGFSRGPGVGFRTPRLGSGSGRQRPGFRGARPWGSGLHDWAPGAGGSGRFFAGFRTGTFAGSLGRCGRPARGPAADQGVRPTLREFLPHQELQLVEKRLFVLKIAVHRRKSYIGDLVELAEALHQKFSYFCSRYFAIR